MSTESTPHIAPEERARRLAVIKAREDELTAAFRPALLAMEAIRAHTKTKGGRRHRPSKDLTGQIACPTCKGTLCYRISAYNNHMAAACDTVACTNFME